MLDVDRFLEDVSGRFARSYTETLRDMLVAVAMRNKPKLSAARKRLGQIISETMGVSEVLGATTTFRRAAKLIESEGLALKADVAHLLAFAEASSQSILPRVTLTEAVQDMIDRSPVTIRRAAERTGQRIAQLYGEGRVVAFVRSAEDAVTERVKSLITEAMREGIPEATTGRLIRMGVEEVSKRTGEWTEGYARMAFRTNVNTAVTAGRFRAAQDQDIKQIMPAFRFDAVGDHDTRDNHNAGDEKIMRVDNLAWNKVAPPLGFNCRCQVIQVGLPELRRMGRINADGSVREDKPPAAWRADQGFRHGGRPDLFMVGNSK